MSQAPDLSLARLDVDGALVESAQRAGGLSRAGFLLGALGGLAAGAAPALGAARGQGPDDVAILNYALVLEYLQASFYTEAERLGALSGRTRRAAEVVGSVERAHVKAFRDLLGGKAVARPAFDFQGVTEDPDTFLKTAVAFEDLAVAAYKGQAPRLRSKEVLAAAVSIHSVEARHAAWMRYLVGANPAQDAFDQPKSKREVDRLVRSTNFVAARPSMRRRRNPRFSG